MDKIEKLEDVIGQKHLINSEGPIRKMIENDSLISLILYGPPGIGKTTLANILATSGSGIKVTLNAATMSKSDLKEASELSKVYPKVIIVIDEIHRMDKIKQDYLLPFMEKSNFIIIGTTTENPYYDVRSAVRSRCLIFELKNPDKNDIFDYILSKHISDEFNLADEIVVQIISICANDIRQINNILRFLKNNYQAKEITDELLTSLFGNNIVHDKTGDNHHNLLSALQKSIRASDVNATLHYSARLLEVSEYQSLWRRLIIIGYEDISNANPQLCARIINAHDSFLRVGMPEGRIILGTLLVDMALSPKSAAAHVAFDKAIQEIKEKNITTINDYIKYNQEDDYKYDKELVKYFNLLPKEIANSEYYYSQEASKYEMLLNKNYLQRKGEVDGKIHK